MLGFLTAIRKGVSKVVSGVGKIVSEVTSHFQFSSVLNAVANVFWSQQIRLPKVSPYLAADGALGTLRVAGIFWLADNLLHLPKAIYDYTTSCPKSEDRAKLIPDSAQEQAFQEFNSWFVWVFDVLASLGYTVRSANLPAFVLGYTLLNAYAWQLGLDGGIRDDITLLGVKDANFKGYVVLASVGAIGFFAKGYEYTRQKRAEKLMHVLLQENPDLADAMDMKALVTKKDYVAWIKKAQEIVSAQTQFPVDSVNAV